MSTTTTKPRGNATSTHLPLFTPCLSLACVLAENTQNIQNTVLHGTATSLTAFSYKKSLENIWNKSFRSPGVPYLSQDENSRGHSRRHASYPGLSQ